MSQLIRLYNHSAVELTKRQKIEKEIKGKKMKVEQLQNKKEALQQDNDRLLEEIEGGRAEHWRQMMIIQKMAAGRQ